MPAVFILDVADDKPIQPGDTETLIVRDREDAVRILKKEFDKTADENWAAGILERLAKGENKISIRNGTGRYILLYVD